MNDLQTRTVQSVERTDLMRQRVKMLPKRDGLSLPSPLRPLSVLVFSLLPVLFCRASDAASSLPLISLLGIDTNRGGVILNCESRGWSLKPEVSWLDGEGKQLSAGPTDPVKGSDDLFTVNSRVTVEKRHSNNFTCRVHQKNPSQTRETHIYIPDDFFEVQSCSSTVTVILAVSLAVSILILLFFVWRQNKAKTKRSHRDEADEERKKKGSKDQFVSVEAGETECLKEDDTVQMKVLKKEKGEKKRKMLEEEQQEREEAQSRVETLTEELETKKNEVKTKQAELQQLHEEQRKIEEELQTLKEELQDHHQQLEEIRATPVQNSWFSRWSRAPSRGEQQQKEAEKRQQLETLEKKLEAHQTQSDSKRRECDDKRREVQQLQAEIQTTEAHLETLTKRRNGGVSA